jgi:hypothetical protein
VVTLALFRARASWRRAQVLCCVSPRRVVPSRGRHGGAPHTVVVALDTVVSVRWF